MKQIDPSGWSRQDFISFYSKVWGCPVLPIQSSKKPAVKSWAQYQTAMPDEKELERCLRSWGITFILKHNLFALDFDKPEAYELFKDRIPAGACVAKSPHGYHCVLRSSSITETIKGGNERLIACLEQISPLLIEVDGAGKKWGKIDILGDNSLLHSPDSPGYTWLELYEEPATINFAQLLSDLFDYRHRISDFIKPTRQGGGGAWLNIYCPWCEFDGKRHDSPSCSVDIDGGGFLCHGSCGKQGKLTELIEYAKEVNYPLPQAVYSWEDDFKKGQGEKVQVSDSEHAPIKMTEWDELEDAKEGLPLIERLLPSGENAKMLIVGPPKIGKTKLGVVIVVCLSQNRKVLGEFVPIRALRCAYGNFEQTGVSIAAEIKSMDPIYGLPPHGMLKKLNLKGRKLSNTNDAEDILKQLNTEPKVEVVVLDGMHESVINFNEPSEVNAVVEFLTRLVDDVGCAVILLHHTKGIPSGQWSDPEAESGLGALGHRLDRWCGSRLVYTNIPGCRVDYYGQLKGQIRGGIGLVAYAVAYTDITDSLHYVSWDDVPGSKARVIRNMPRARSFQQFMIYARAKGYRQTDIAKALGVSDETIRKWNMAESEPSDEHWPDVEQLKQRLIRGERIG